MITESKIKKFASCPKTPLMTNVGFTPEERTAFREIMSEAGMCFNTLYQRMAYIGFNEWEAKGIKRCIKDFCLYDGELKDFYKWLDETGNRQKFIKHMEKRGLSRKTTERRFAQFDFKPWELEGIESILRRIV